MGHPRFTGCVRSLTSLGPLGPISCLDLACKENSRPSKADSEVEPSKHTGRTETGGNEECKGGRVGGMKGGYLQERLQLRQSDPSHITTQ